MAIATIAVLFGPLLVTPATAQEDPLGVRFWVEADVLWEHTLPDDTTQTSLQEDSRSSWLGYGGELNGAVYTVEVDDGFGETVQLQLIFDQPLATAVPSKIESFSILRTIQRFGTTVTITERWEGVDIPLVGIGNGVWLFALRGAEAEGHLPVWEYVETGNFWPLKKIEKLSHTFKDPAPGDSEGHELKVSFYYPGPIKIEMAALGVDAIENLPEKPKQGKVTALRPVTSRATLEDQPSVTKGFVADGVTPLLLKIDASGLGERTDVEVRVSAFEGDVTGGIEAKVRVLQEGAWVPLADVANSVTLAPEAKTFLCVGAVHGWELERPEPEPQLKSETQAERVRFLLRLIAPELPGEVRKEFKIHRPPLMLVSRSPRTDFPDWSDATIDRFKEIYGDDFVRPLPVHDEEFELNGWLEELRQDWAVTRADCVADLLTIPWLLQLCRVEGSKSVFSGESFQRPPFRNGLNHNRGWFQNIVTINGCHRGSRLYTYISALQERSEEMAADSGTFNHIPQLTRVFNPFANAVYNLPVDKLFSPVSDLYTGRIPRVTFDPSAKFHHLATKLNPDLALAYHFIGLNGVRLEFVAPEGSDGVLDFDSSRAGPNRRHSEVLGNVSTLPGRVWGTDRYIYDDVLVTEEILETLQSSHDSPLRPYGAYSPVSTDDLLYTSILPSGGTAIRLIESAGREAVTAITELISVSPGRGTRDGSSVEIYSIAPDPGDPPAGAVTWMVETQGPGGVTDEGVEWQVVEGEPLQVEVKVGASVVGDTVVYASYPTASGQIVLGRPQLVRRAEPAGTSITGITISPGDLELAIGERADLRVFVDYDDGTQLQRWVTADDVMVTSSDAAVVDASDEGHWLAAGVGMATVTVQAFGFSAASEITVYDPYVPQTFSEWREEQFSPEELADPAVSGAGVDLDGDSLDLVFEYVSGGRPRFRDGAILSFLPVDVAGESELALVVRVSRSLGGQATVQRSGDLQSWEDWFLYDPVTTDLGAAPVVDVHDIGPWRYLFLWDEPMAAAPGRRHFRLRFDDAG